MTGKAKEVCPVGTREVVSAWIGAESGARRRTVSFHISGLGKQKRRRVSRIKTRFDLSRTVIFV